MMTRKLVLLTYCSIILSLCRINSVEADLKTDALATMKQATRFMVEEVSTNGGYVWHYLPDMSRRWGELEAYPTMIWVQPPGTASMGQLYLDVYRATGDEYYYNAAEKVANALIWGQLDCGGWNYSIDFAGDRSLKSWYGSIGKHAWGFEEFNHYYGNATFDDNVSSDAARFLLRMYLEKLDPTYRPALDKAINFIIESQYPIGGWPQRYPLSEEYSHPGKPDYTSFHTFNDDVVWENVNFLIQCYITLGEERFLDPIRRGMNFYLITQQGPPQAGWGQQYNTALEPVGARSYEPDALMPSYTAAHIRLLMRFYRLTGETKFLGAIPPALDWLDSCRLPDDLTEDGKYTHPTFIEPGTGKRLYAHRTGSGIYDGHYFVNYDDSDTITHYGQKTRIDTDALRGEFETLSSLPAAEATKGSPLIPGKHEGTGTPQSNATISSEVFTASGLRQDNTSPDRKQIRNVIGSLDTEGRWLTTGMRTNRPYSDKSNTATFRDESDQEYISTRTYISNMRVLMKSVGANR